jgi:hypothetical protein
MYIRGPGKSGIGWDDTPKLFLIQTSPFSNVSCCIKMLLLL